jgi:hypothetical protein
VLDARFGRGERTRGGGRLPIPRLIDAARQGSVVKLKVTPGFHEFYTSLSARRAIILQPAASVRLTATRRVDR